MFTRLTVLFWLACSTASADVITVLSDVNPFRHTALPSGNEQVAQNILANAQSVLMSTQTSGFGLEGIGAEGLAAFYDGLSGLGFTRTNAELSPVLLNGVDLLVLDLAFDRASPYSAAEVSVIANFLQAGDVFFIAESGNRPDSIASYNALLSGVGSTIQFESTAKSGAGSSLADTILSTPLTSGVTSFELASANNLLGGMPSIRDNGFTILASQQVVAVPEPSLAAMIGMALFMILCSRRRPMKVAGRTDEPRNAPKSRWSLHLRRKSTHATG